MTRKRGPNKGKRRINNDPDEVLLRNDELMTHIAESKPKSLAPVSLEDDIMRNIALLNDVGEESGVERVANNIPAGRVKTATQSELNLDFTDTQRAVESHPAPLSQTDVRHSWLFFLVGAVCGMIISLLLPAAGEILPGVTGRSLSFIFQLLFAAIILTQLDALIRLTRAIRASSEPPSA